MTINDFHVIGIAVFPDKTNTVLIVDPNAVLPQPITLQSFQAVAGEIGQVFQLASRMLRRLIGYATRSLAS